MHSSEDATVETVKLRPIYRYLRTISKSSIKKEEEQGGEGVIFEIVKVEMTLLDLAI